MGWVSRLRSLDPKSVLALLVPVVLVCWTLGAARPPAQFPLDLIPTYVAGKLWLAGKTHAIYHQGAWLPLTGANPEWIAMVQTHGITMPDTAFTYSPVYLALWLPFIALLTPLQFYWGFAALSALCSLLLGWEAAGLARVKQNWLRLCVALFVALSFPCSYAGMLGQNVIMAALLVLLGFRALERERTFVGVALLLLGCAFKTWCVLFLLVLLLGGRWRATLLFLAGWLASFVVLPRSLFPAPLLDGHDRVLATLPEVSVLAFNNVSLRALIHRLSMDDWTSEAWSWSKHGIVSGSEFALELVLVAFIVGLYALLTRLRRPPLRALYVESMALVLIALGVCWSHYLVFALPLLVRTVFDEKLPWALRGVAVMLGLWLWQMMSAAAPVLQVMRPPSLWALVYSAPLLLSVALPVALAGLRTRRLA